MTLSEDQQRAVFAAVVSHQDFLLTNAKNNAAVLDAVARARGIVAAQFSVPASEVKLIERVGIDKQWSPLAA